MAKRRKRNPELSYEAGDLILFADNTEPLYKDKQRAIRRVIKSLNRGTYTKSIGVHIWRPFVEKAAGRYRLELGTTIPRTAKTEAANEYEKDALSEIMVGDWEWVEELIPRAEYSKGNPMTKKKTKRKATRKQLANLAKGRAALARKRRASKKVRRVVKKKTAKRGTSRVTHPKARAALRQPRNPVKPSSRASPHYAIKQGARFYDGSGFTKDKRDAAMWMNLNRCKRVAQKVADATGKACEIVH